MNLILIIIALLAAVVIIWLLISRKQNQAQKPVAYVCDQCGELHCDCHEQSDNGRRP